MSICARRKMCGIYKMRETWRKGGEGEMRGGSVDVKQSCRGVKLALHEA